jgi:hypothetical protein
VGPMRPLPLAKPEVEADDPYAPVFVALPSPPGFDAMGEMARCMVEEYAMMGFSAPLLLKMFKNPYYQALHRVYQARGEGYVSELLERVFEGTGVPSEGSAPPSESPGLSLDDSPVVSGASPSTNPRDARIEGVSDA